MLAPLNSRHLPAAQTALRIAAGLTYFSHGAAKTFGWFGGMGPNGGTVDLFTRFGAAGAIEVVCGAFLVLGLGTRLFAFIASGEMAVAYFWVHTGGSGKLWWWSNHGELVMLYSFIWLVYAAWGAGPFSLDARLQRSRGAP
jgi:putative oxidoreductase